MNKGEWYTGFEVQQNDGCLYIENMGRHENECSQGDQTDKMIKVRTSLPSEGESIKNKGPSIPLRTEVRPTVWRKTDMVIPTFVISHSLETIVKDVTGEVSNNIQGEGKFFDPQVEKSLITAHVGY